MKLDFSYLIDKKIVQLFLIIWPPYGENNKENLDVSIGIVISEVEEVIIITTSRQNNWTPLIYKENRPEFFFSHKIFEKRIYKWMNSEINDIIDNEYYDFTDSDLFTEIIGQKIETINFIFVEKENPFGVKLNFKNDYIISTPISDGNTIESKKFNVTNNIDKFRFFGEIRYYEVNKIDK